MGMVMLHRGEAKHKAMARFILMVDRWWDMVNASKHTNIEADTKIKPDRKAYTDPNDPRLTVGLLLKSMQSQSHSTMI